MNVENIAAALAKNIMGEQEAIEGYYHLLALVKENGLPLELCQQIEEIISDEMNHSVVLAYWVSKLTGITAKED